MAHRGDDNLNGLTPWAAAAQYRRLLDRYATRERFGLVSGRTGQPTHVNHSANPRPSWGNGARRERTCGPKRLIRHLEGTKENRQAAFLVNRPDAPVYLLALDLDCERDAADGPARCLDLSERFQADLGGRTFMEPSRGGAGRYNWILVRRSPDEPVEVFTERLNRLNRRLRERYGTKKTSNGVGVDAIKGAAWHETDNPGFDPPSAYDDWSFITLDRHNEVPCPDWIESPVERYRWHLWHYRDRQHLPYLEERALHYGVLVTMPLHGVRHDPDGGLARWRAFFRWEADPANVIPSSELWATFGVADPQSACEASYVTEITDIAEAAGVSVDTRPVVPVASRRGRVWDMLRSDDKLVSMNGAASITVGARGADATVDDVLAVYEQHGAASLDNDTPERLAHRRSRASESLEYFRETFDPSSRGVVWFDEVADVKAEEGRINSVVSGALLDEVNRLCGSSIRRHRLPLYWLVCAKLIVANAGALSVASLDGFLRRFDIALNGTELKAILTLFTRAGLIRCLDADYRFWGDRRLTGGSKLKGKCRLWDFAPGAPLPRFVLKAVPHRISHNGCGRYLPATGSKCADTGESVTIAPAGTADRPGSGTAGPSQGAALPPSSLPEYVIRRFDSRASSGGAVSEANSSPSWSKLSESRRKRACSPRSTARLPGRCTFVKRVPRGVYRDCLRGGGDRRGVREPLAVRVESAEPASHAKLRSTIHH